MKGIVKRVFVSLLCLLMVVNGNVTQAFCTESGDVATESIVGGVATESITSDDGESYLSDETEGFEAENSDEETLAEECIEETSVQPDDICEQVYEEDCDASDEEKMNENEVDEIAFDEEIEMQGEYTYKPYEGASYEFKYTVTDGCATITGCEGDAKGNLIIPDSIEGYKVTQIADKAFIYEIGFKGVLEIGQYVTKIGKEAFRNCSYLHGQLTIPDGVTEIGEGAFKGCSNLSVVKMSESCSCGENAFEGCKFTIIYLTFSGYTLACPVSDGEVTILYVSAGEKKVI